jgi:hypothetical protein
VEYRAELAKLDRRDDNYTNLIEEIGDEFLYAVKQDFLQILKDEYEWMTSDEQAAEAIIDNGYEFTAEGKII